MRFISAAFGVGVAYVFTHIRMRMAIGDGGCGYAPIAHAYHALQHALQLYFTMADKEDLHESAADLSFDEWVMRNGGSESFISLLAEFGFTSRLPLQHLNEEATELFERMNCGQRSLLRGLISLSSPKAVESEHSGYGKCLEKISTCKQASGGVKSKLSQLFSLQKPKQADGESSSSSFKPQPLVSHKIRKRTSSCTPSMKPKKSAK